MKRERRRFGAMEKVKIIREHLLDARPISQLCEKYSIAPTQFYQWQKTFFENGAAAFEQKNDTGTLRLEQENVKLQKKLVRKDEVIAELVEHNIDLKKNLGMD